MHGSAMSFEKTAASIFTPTPSACSINWSPPYTVAMCLPSPVGAMLIRAQICWVSRNGKPCVWSYAAHSGSRPSHSPFSTRCGANCGHCAIRLLTKNSSYNAVIVADDGLTGLSVPMFPKPRDDGHHTGNQNGSFTGNGHLKVPL